LGKEKGAVILSDVIATLTRWRMNYIKLKALSARILPGSSEIEMVVVAATRVEGGVAVGAEGVALEVDGDC
jgi:hypothetical protein